jgi:hypothetical protein
MFFMPMLIGAALGGGISALRGGDPLKGALMGAAGGALGGATGLLGAGTGATTGAATGGGFAGGGFGSVGLAGQTALQGGGGGLFGNTMANIGSGLKGMQTFMQQNPVLAQQSLGLANNLMQTPQVQMAPSAGLMRGQMMQQQPMQFDMQAPQISLI